MADIKKVDNSLRARATRKIYHVMYKNFRNKSIVRNAIFKIWYRLEWIRVFGLKDY